MSSSYFAGPAIEVANVTKRYRGRTALTDVSLTVQQGEIVGFIGPNGSGKTTLIHIIAGLVRPDAGEVSVRQEARVGGRPPTVGLVLERQGLIPHLTARQNLELLTAISGGVTTSRITEVIAAVGLDPTDLRQVRDWSQGMRQRLALAQALVEQPSILLLDEPTNGLDPVGVADLRVLLARLAADGVAILLASHALTEVERLCSRAYFVRSGTILEVIDVKNSSGVAVSVESSEAVALIEAWASQQGAQVTVTAPLTVRLDTALPVADLIIELVRSGVRITKVGDASQELERRFLELAQGSGTV